MCTQRSAWDGHTPGFVKVIACRVNSCRRGSTKVMTESNLWMLIILSLKFYREQHVPDSSHHSLSLTKLFNSSFPEGNFGGNQLLDGSISFPPLYPRITNDLHGSIASSLHQSFSTLCPSQAAFTIFQVLTLFSCSNLFQNHGTHRQRHTYMHTYLNTYHSHDHFRLQVTYHDGSVLSDEIRN